MARTPAPTPSWASRSTSIGCAARSGRWRAASPTAEHGRDRPAQVAQVERLDEIGGKTLRSRRRGVVWKRGDRDHGQRAAPVGRQLPQPLEEIRARSVGQHEIGHDDVGRLGHEQRAGLGERRPGDGPRAAELEGGLHGVADLAVVFDDQDRGPVQGGQRLGAGHGQDVSPLAVPTAVFWPWWFSHHPSTPTRVASFSGRSSRTTPRMLRRSPAYTGWTKATDMVPPRMKPAPKSRVIISETYAVDIIPCASVVRNPF